MLQEFTEEEMSFIREELLQESPTNRVQGEKEPTSEKI